MSNNSQDAIYLDYQATTPLDKRVLDSMMPFLTNEFGNPHSTTHSYGKTSANAVEKARKSIADIIKTGNAKDIVFTSGATESNNLAIKGTAEYYGKQGKNHLIVASTDHKCVVNTARELENKGICQVTYLSVDEDGIVDLKELEQAITDKTFLVSIMAANNETGVISPLKEIGEICRKGGTLFHTDSAQAIGKIHIDVNEMNIDLLSISSHKIYGPKGVGALFVRRRPGPRVKLIAQMNGGGQERGLRSGTLAPFLCVGMGKACDILMEEMDQEIANIQKLRDHMWQRLNSELEDIKLNGSQEHRLANNLNISFSYVEGESLMLGLPDLALSSGSACTSESLEPSYVLREMKIPPELSHTSLRISIGRFTTLEEINKACDDIVKAVKRLRDLSPLYDMAKEGIDINSIEWAEH